MDNPLDLDHLVRVCEAAASAHNKSPRDYGALSVAEYKSIEALEDIFTPPVVLSLLHRLQAAEKRVRELEGTVVIWHQAGLSVERKAP